MSPERNEIELCFFRLRSRARLSVDYFYRSAADRKSARLSRDAIRTPTNVVRYFAERCHYSLANWRVLGPRGLVEVYSTESDAQAEADILNKQAAEDADEEF